MRWRESAEALLRGDPGKRLELVMKGRHEGYELSYEAAMYHRVKYPTVFLDV